MKKDLKKHSDALVIAAMLQKCSPHTIGAHKNLMEALNAITEHYHFSPGDPLEDTEFSNLVDLYTEELKNEELHGKASLLFRSRFGVAI